MKRVVLSALLLSFLAPLSGCKLFGALAVNLGLVPSKKVEALYAFGAGPVLILVDDDAELVTWSQTALHLSERIQHYVGKARRAQGNKIEATFVRPRNVAALRRDDPGFDRRSIPEIAEILSASEVLWIQIVQFVVSGDAESAEQLNAITVRVKVFDPNLPRSQRRVWPDTRDGEIASVQRPASVETMRMSDSELARDMVDELAEKIGEMFYDHRVEQGTTE